MMGMPVTPTGPKPAVEAPPAPPPPRPSAPAEAPPRASTSTGPIATFLIRSGNLKGQRLTVRVPVVNIGRAEYNDLVIAEDSVSGSHAKLQRREGVWVLTDNDSTNGTWVDGERVQGEVMLGPGSVVRFGEISVLFEPTDDHLGTGAGSGTKVMGAIRTPAPPPPAAPAAAPPPLPASPEPMREAATPTAPRPAPEPPRTPPPERMASAPAPRRPVVVSSPPSPGMPRWVVPLVVVIILAVAAFFLFGN
jgi:pSer/pThr/pTyr-binding forkhead associated (FHA) protein